MKRPLAWLAFIFCLGIFLGNHTRAPFILILLLAIIFLGFCILSIGKKLGFDIILCCLVFILGIAALKNSRNLPNCHISKFIAYKSDKLYTVRGFIDTQPISKDNRTSFVFKANQIQIDNLKYPCCGSILVQVKGKRDFLYGEDLILKGNLYRPFGSSGNSRKSYRQYLYNQGIYSMMNVKLGGRTIKLNKNKGFVIKRLAFWLKQKMENIIFKYVSFSPASILDAMILGERRHIPAWINNSMVKSGTVHILVVSGFNVGIVAFIIILFLRLIRLPKRMRIYIGIPLLILYCLLTGASNPVVRATLMAIIFICAYLVKRGPDIYNSCAIAAIVILGINPRQLFDAGFQLSFVSVASIICLYPRLKSLLRLDYLKIKYIRFFFESCLVSLSCWLGTMGFIAHYFRIFSPITVVANIFIVPLATLITLCGFTLIIMGFLCPPLAQILASSSELLVMLLLNINAALIKIPGAYFYLS